MLAIMMQQSNEYHNKYNILNLIMDEICAQRSSLVSIGSLLQTNELFMTVCNDQHIFTLLFEFIGYPAFVELTATCSKISKTILKNQNVQAFILKLKITKLKKRELQRQFPNLFKKDFWLFDPFTLPPYQQDSDIEPEMSAQERQKELQLIQASKLRQIQLSKTRDWAKWRTGKRVQMLLGQKRPQKQLQTDKNVKVEVITQNQISYDQKLKSIQQAQAMLQLKSELTRKVIEQYPRTKNSLQEMRNRHFAQSILGKPEQPKIQPKLIIEPRIINEPKVNKQKLIPQQFKPGQSDVFSIMVKNMMIEEVQEHRRRKQTNIVSKGITKILDIGGLGRMLGFSNQ